jgi:hypothetical protein
MKLDKFTNVEMANPLLKEDKLLWTSEFINS